MYPLPQGGRGIRGEEEKSRLSKKRGTALYTG